MTTTEQPASSSKESSKRKLELVLKHFDDAIVHRQSQDSPTKRRKLIPRVDNVYKMQMEQLEKKSFGMSTESQDTRMRLSMLKSITAPFRAASRSASAPNYLANSAPTTSRLATYQPSSREDFLARLDTFRHSDWMEFSNMIPAPEDGSVPPLGSVSLALHGWHLSAKASRPSSISSPSALTQEVYNSEPSSHVNIISIRVKCGFCNQGWTLSVPRIQDDFNAESDMNDVSAGRLTVLNKVADKLALQIRSGEAHALKCPWRDNSCDAFIYSVPLIDPQAAQKQMQERRKRLAALGDSLPYDVKLGDRDTEALSQTVSSCLPTLEQEDVAITRSLHKVIVAYNLLALFGWDILQPPAATPKQCILTCNMCLRRIGCWSFTSVADDNGSVNSDTEPLDVAGQHQVYCPWINPRKLSNTDQNTKPVTWEALLGILERLAGIARPRSINDHRGPERNPLNALAYVKKLLGR